MRWLIPAGLLWALSARAHDADVIYVLVQHGSQPGVLVETVTLTFATLGYLAPLDADGDSVLSQGDLDAKTKALRAGFWDDVPLAAQGRPCELFEPRALLREGFVELQGQFRCGEGELRQDFRILRVLPANYRVVLGSQLDGEGEGRAPSTGLGTGFAQGSMTTISLPRPPPPGSWDGAGFRRALDQGIARGLSLEVLAALLSILIALGAWRRGMGATGLVIAGVLAGSGASLGWWPPMILLFLIAGGAALRTPPLIVPLLLGAAIGLREGGDGLSASVGQGVGTALVLLLASPVALAAGVMLQRRPRLLRVARWVPVLLVALSLGLRARLSW